MDVKGQSVLDVGGKIIMLAEAGTTAVKLDRGDCLHALLCIAVL
jgi:hypothetical protein